MQLRPYIASILFLLYAFSMVRPVSPVLFYGLDKAYFAEVLCENKARPELNCEGHCVLTKAVEDFNDYGGRENVPPPRFNDIHLLVLNLTNQYAGQPELSNLFRDDSQPLSDEALCDIFHPPRMG